MKTLKQILEVYSPKSADEKRFVKKHIVVKTADASGNGDDVYTGSNVKEIDRKKTRKGYNTKDSESVYEAKKPMSQAEKDKVTGAVRAAMLKSYGNVVAGQAQLAAARLAAKIKSGTKGKTAKEEIEQADEGIGTLAVKAAGVVKDVISKEKAYQAQKQKKAGEVLNKIRATKEEIEQVDELKKSTLRSYVDKAKAENLPGKGGNRGVALLTPGTRDKGVHKAVDRMKKMKEEVEQLDEVGNTPAGRKALRSYVTKATKNVNDAYADHARGSQSPDPHDRELAKGYLEKANKRVTSIYKAKDRLKDKSPLRFGEEVEQVDELEKSTLKSYIDKARVDVKQGKKSDKREAGIKDAARKFMSFKGTANKRKMKEEVEQVDEAKTSDVSVKKIYDDGDTKEWHMHRGKEMIGYVWKNVPNTAEGLYIASGYGPGRGFTKEFNSLNSAVNYIKSLKGTANKRKMKEEIEQVDEVLKVSAGAGEWIKDFQTSDNPKFAGKSKEQRKQQALAAYYAAKRAGKE